MKTSAVRATAWLLFASVSSAAHAADHPSIPEQVREHGEFERMIVRVEKPTKLADLVGASDLVVEASARSAQAFLDKSETHIYTDYRFTMNSIVQNRRQPGLLSAGQEIVVRRESGTVTIDGRPATSIESDFPAFEAGQSYVLFLKHSSKDGVYTVVAGPLGAFNSGEQVVPLATAADASVPWPASPRDTFLGELRALLKFSN